MEFAFKDQSISDTGYGSFHNANVKTGIVAINPLE